MPNYVPEDAALLYPMQAVTQRTVPVVRLLPTSVYYSCGIIRPESAYFALFRLHWKSPCVSHNHVNQSPKVKRLEQLLEHIDYQKR